MSDIFQEVDEDVRRDKAAEFWAKYQNFVFAGAALIVLATAAYRYYDYRRVQAAESAGAAFQAALTLEHDGKTADAQAALAKVAGSAPAGYAALSRFAAAAAAAGSAFSGLSATSASVVSSSPAMDAAFCSADSPASTRPLKELQRREPWIQPGVSRSRPRRSQTRPSFRLA